MPEQELQLPVTWARYPMAQLVVRAMQAPGHYWKDLKAMSRLPDELFEDPTVVGGMKSSRSGREKIRDAFATRAIRTSEDERKRVSDLVTGSKRFVLDPNFIAMVTASNVFNDPDMAADLIQLARLPFPNVWIEMDFTSIGKGQHGYLIERVDPHDATRWVVHTFTAEDGRTVAAQPYVQFVSTTGDALGPVPEPYVLIDPVASGIRPDIAYAGIAGFDARDGSMPFDIPEGFAGAFNLAHLPLYRKTLGEWMTDLSGVLGDGSRETLASLEEGAIRDAGNLRWILAILATINHLPYTVVERPVASRAARGETMPIGVISLHADLVRSANRFRDDIAEAATKAAHDVRGHWRTLRNDDGSVRKRVWVRDHRRGHGDQVVERSYEADVAPQPLPAPVRRPGLLARLRGGIGRLLGR